MARTSPKPSPPTCRESTSGQADSRVRTFLYLAGNEGLQAERSSLFFEIIRLLKGTPAEDRPEWLVLENVKNLLSVNRGWDFATVLNSLAEIGYHIEYGLLNSRFHGVPQNRERIYLVAYRHFRAEGGRKIFPVTASDGKALIQLIGGTQGKRVYDPAGVSCTLMSEGGGFAGRTGMYFIDLCKGESELTEHARCIKQGMTAALPITAATNSGVLCVSGECPDRTEETALIQLKSVAIRKFWSRITPNA